LNSPSVCRGFTIQNRKKLDLSFTEYCVADYVQKNESESGYCEKTLHEIFKKRIRGEWFSLTENDIEFIKNYDYK